MSDFERLVRLVGEVTNERVSRDGFSLSTKPGQKSRRDKKPVECFTSQQIIFPAADTHRTATINLQLVNWQ